MKHFLQMKTKRYLQRIEKIIFEFGYLKLKVTKNISKKLKIKVKNITKKLSEKFRHLKESKY